MTATQAEIEGVWAKLGVVRSPGVDMSYECRLAARVVYLEKALEVRDQAPPAASTPPPPLDAQATVRALLEHLGEDPTRPGLRETPERVVKSWGTLFGGYEAEKALPTLLKEFDEPCDEMIVLRNVEFYSTCEHHALPFVGKAHVGYLPDGKRVVGVSKLARVVEVFARRLQIQERIGQQVTDALMTHLKPRGAGVVIEAKHFCMLCRGVGKQNSEMITSSLAGVFRTDPAVRAEFLGFVVR